MLSLVGRIPLLSCSGKASSTSTNSFNLGSTGIASYYGAIKKYFPTQWGRLYSYETIDTGFYHDLYNADGSIVNNFPTIFGGDIFINRFAYKSKQSIFRNTTVGAPNQADIPYDELGTINYPMFWLSTKPERYDIDIDSEIDKVVAEIDDPSFGKILLNVVTGGGVGESKATKLILALTKEIYKKIGIKNINLDDASINGLCELGKMYLFNYGIPYFFCESEINVDFRQAYNDREGNFYPNVGGDIPDDWLQEVNVPIINDNTYIYNQTYSKQNKEDYFAHLSETWDPTKPCYTYFPNRAIWSDSSSVEEIKNNWLVYRAANRFDFPKSYGSLISIDSIEHRQLMVRYENKSQLYNALTTVDVSQGLNAYLGNPKLFSATLPLDLSNTDVGYAGSQHQFFLKTEFGNIFIDAKRGQIILSKGSSIQDLADIGMDKWFSENLPFKILSVDSSIPIDNNFNGFGLHGVYDAFFQRIIITKLDYQPLNPSISYRSGKFYLDDKEISVNDSTYFCNKSWTLSFSFKTNTWISFHSFIPNYYIPFPNYFQSGINSTPSLWNHNKSVTNFGNYYSTQYPYILEYPYVYKFQDEILQSIKDYSSVRVYSDFYTYYEPDETIYFNKAIISNGQQCSGTLLLTPKPKNNLQSYNTFPKYNADSCSILVTKSDNWYNFNTIWDKVKEKNIPNFISTCSPQAEEKKLNNSNMDYSVRSFKKNNIRAKDCKVRLILDNRNDIKIISRYSLTETTPSYK